MKFSVKLLETGFQTWMEPPPRRFFRVRVSFARSARYRGQSIRCSRLHRLVFLLSSPMQCSMQFTSLHFAWTDILAKFFSPTRGRPGYTIGSPPTRHVHIKLSDGVEPVDRMLHADIYIFIQSTSHSSLYHDCC